MATPLTKSAPAAPQRGLFGGAIDWHGTGSGEKGWFACGWLGTPWRDLGQQEGVAITIETSRAAVPAAAIPAVFERDDIRQQGVGLILFVPGIADLPGDFTGLSIRSSAGICRLRLAGPAAPTEPAATHARLQAVLPACTPLPNRDAMRAHIAPGEPRPAAADVTKLVGLEPAIACGPEHLLISGWMLADTADIAAIRLCQPARTLLVDPAQLLRVERPDLAGMLNDEWDQEYHRHGFMVLLPIRADAGPLSLDIHFHDGTKLTRPLDIGRARGLQAMRQVLALPLAQLGDLNHAFDSVLGPAMGLLQRAARQRPAEIRHMTYGAAPASPACSIIVPLYGRIDFMEVQLALLSADIYIKGTCEILYVLDDPAKRQETADLAHSLHTRLGMPFRLLMLDRNVGFAAASNAGLAAAAGTFICFLNSDVFPQQPGWLQPLTQRLRASAKLGAVGPLLLFEDGSVQHEGMSYAPEPDIGGWTFPSHDNKGRRPTADTGLHRVEALTGACMVMRRSVAQSLGGFDEDYVVGDFEDSDLCRRLAKRGLACAVDRAVRLVHLERQSQLFANQTWRRNVTAYNAWLHQRRWFA